MLSYFGCDQSQVQRYLTAKSVDEGRDSLLMSAYVKIPLQALVLLTGVLVFVFYLFNQPPMLFNRCTREKIEKSARAGELPALESEFGRPSRRGAAPRRRCGGRDERTRPPARRSRDERLVTAFAPVRPRSRASDGDERYKDSPGTRRRRTSTTSSRRS